MNRRRFQTIATPIRRLFCTWMESFVFAQGKFSIFLGIQRLFYNDCMKLTQVFTLLLRSLLNFDSPPGRTIWQFLVLKTEANSRVLYPMLNRVLALRLSKLSFIELPKFAELQFL